MRMIIHFEVLTLASQASPAVPSPTVAIASSRTKSLRFLKGNGDDALVGVALGRRRKQTLGDEKDQHSLTKLARENDRMNAAWRGQQRCCSWDRTWRAHCLGKASDLIHRSLSARRQDLANPTYSAKTLWGYNSGFTQRPKPRGAISIMSAAASLYSPKTSC